MATELERFERGERAPDGYPRPGRMLLAYQLPTLILAVLALSAPLALVLVGPVAVLLLIAGWVGYGLERAQARASPPARPSLARALARHQLCAGLLLQPYIVGAAYVLASIRVLQAGPGFDLESFLIVLAIGEGLYAVCVVLPLWLLVAREAHRVSALRAIRG